MAKIAFNTKENHFYNSLREEVAAYFKTNGIKQTGDYRLYIKLFVLVPLAIAIYCSLLLVTMPAWAGIVLSGLEGFVLACIGFNVMHDACHSSYSTKKWVNTFLGYSLNAMGGNSFIWKSKHNSVHHTFTNVDGIDDDIAKLPVIRQCPSQKWNPMHRYQYIYIGLVYALSSFLWIALMDFQKYFKRKVLNTDLPEITTEEHVVFWMSKILYVVFYIAIPIAVVGFTPWLIGFSMMHIFLGFTLAIVFQLAHVVESTHFVDGATTTKSEDEWAVHQVRTTANFATDNSVVSWFVGGLNFQVEHHLFPRVSHVHYPVIRTIVKSHCEKFGVQYNEYPTLISAVASHVRFMKQLGKG